MPLAAIALQPCVGALRRIMPFLMIFLEEHSDIQDHSP